MRKKEFIFKLTNRQKYLMCIVFIPFYLLYGATIVALVMQFILSQMSIEMELTTFQAYLNFYLDFILIGILIWIFKDMLKKQAIEFMNHFKKNILQSLVIGPILVMILNMLGTLLMIYCGVFATENQNTVVQILNEQILVFEFTAVCLAPVIEELLFRGFVMNWIYEIHPLLAHIVSALTFGFLHVFNVVLSGDMTGFVQMIPYAFMGLGLSYFYEKVIIYIILLDKVFVDIREDHINMTPLFLS